jgi:hypothetical protein
MYVIVLRWYAAPEQFGPTLLGTTYPRLFPPGNFKLDRTWVI